MAECVSVSVSVTVSVKTVCLRQAIRIQMVTTKSEVRNSHATLLIAYSGKTLCCLLMTNESDLDGGSEYAECSQLANQIDKMVSLSDTLDTSQDGLKNGL